MINQSTSNAISRTLNTSLPLQCSPGHPDRISGSSSKKRKVEFRKSTVETTVLSEPLDDVPSSTSGSYLFNEEMILVQNVMININSEMKESDIRKLICNSYSSRQTGKLQFQIPQFKGWVADSQS